MKQTFKHPSRAALMRATRSEDPSVKAHMEKCSICRRLFELMKLFPVAGQSLMEKPGERAIARYAAIPELLERDARPRREFGEVSFDSWANLPPLAVRDAGQGFVRHLCLKARELRLEIVAERLRDCWEFTARVYRGDDAATEWALCVAGKRHLPQSQGFYHWSSRTAPRTIKLQTRSRRVEFEKLSWE